MEKISLPVVVSVSKTSRALRQRSRRRRRRRLCRRRPCLSSLGERYFPTFLGSNSHYQPSVSIPVKNVPQPNQLKTVFSPKEQEKTQGHSFVDGLYY